RSGRRSRRSSPSAPTRSGCRARRERRAAAGRTSRTRGSRRGRLSSRRRSQEELGQVGVERIAPRDPVVGVRVLDERRRPALTQEGGRDRAVVAEVLLGGSAREGEGDSIDVAASAEDARDEARDPGEARGARLLRIEPAAEEAPGLEEEAAEGPRASPVRVEKRERAEARTHPDRASAVRLEPGQPVLGQRPSVTRRRRVALVPVAGRGKQRRAERRQLAEGHEVVEEAQQQRELRVLGAVVDEQQRQRPLRRLGGGPDDCLNRLPLAEVELRQRAGRRLGVVDPLGTLVLRELEHRLRPERPLCLQRVGGIGNDLRLALPRLELEQVLEPVRRRTVELELEPVAASLERDPARADELVEERHAPERTLAVTDGEERAVPGDDRRRRGYFCLNRAITVR